YRYPFFLCDQNLRIVGTNSGRVDDDLCITNVFSGVPFEDSRPTARFKPVGVLRTLDIGTRYIEAEIAKHLRNAAHAYAADADKMYSFYVSKHQTLLFNSSI